MGRRSLIKGVGAVAAGAGMAALAGCSGGGGGTGGQADQEVYVMSFHWGFRLVKPDGTVSKSIDVPKGNSVALHGVNVLAVEAGNDLGLPDPVKQAVTDDASDWKRASVERIAPKLGTPTSDLKDKQTAAEKQYPDHSMAIVDPGGSTKTQAALSGSMSSPATKTVTFDSSGDWSIECETFCGDGHTYMQLDGAFSVS